MYHNCFLYINFFNLQNSIMKKTASILIILTLIPLLIYQLIGIPEQLEYASMFYIPRVFLWPINTIAIILFFIAILNEGNSSKIIINEKGHSQENLNLNDSPSTVINIISFLIPLAGLVIYLIEKEKAPKKANAAGKAALWGVGIGALLTIISVIISISMINNIY